MQLVGRRRGGVHAAELVALPEPRPRQDERHLLDELADRARPARLLRRPEPPPRELPVLLVGRASGERHVAGQEAARGAPLQHQHLEPLLGVARDHGRRRLADLVVHERHPRTHPHHRHPRTAADGPRVTRLGTVSDPVARRVRAAIEDHGPIGFDEYMEIALYGPGGFFETPPVGADGHFVTSPHVHPFVFAHCVRDALLDAWFALGEPEPLPVVELGAGDGTFADALLVRVRRAARTATRLHRRRDQHRRTRRARRTRVRDGVRARRAGTVRGCGGRERGPRQPAVRPGPRPTRRPEGGPGGRAGRVARRDRGAVVERVGATPAARAGRGDDRAGRGVRAPARRSRGCSDAATSC